MRHLRTHTLHRLRRRCRAHWPAIKRTLIVVVLLVVAGLIFHVARSIDWPQVWRAMRDIPARNIGIACALVVAGYAAYASLDLLAQRYTRHKLPWSQVAGVALISYAMNLNLGVLVGGLGMRLRLYAKLGVRKSVATRVALFSAATNWIGYAWIGGAVFAAGAVPVPASWEIGKGVLRIVGVVILILAVVYVAYCARARQRSYHLFGQHLVLPGGRMAVAQSLLAALSWAIMGGIMWVLLQGKADYAAVLGVLLCTSFAALITRIPGGLGTTEAIFVAAFSGQLPTYQVLGAALTYRALYALVPLAIAVLSYAAVETRLALRRRHGGARLGSS
ncbi:hypothetical protein CEG14_09250 [Bordetella genomosp. 1]|uniref:Lysylphosphatidylglycerol synthetase family protein n=1 Tax=Bordetella genomosp. 1 TaxID=1395607 RepID=A0A261SEP6_9BORD|nr:lysylphosphatidylglycerol synthase domain-containing protein [Bordetella genomosp. 1]OZI35280.1 hypothetical protein CEG14_09250 [Bordetella genomosp. 1]